MVQPSILHVSPSTSSHSGDDDMDGGRMVIRFIPSVTFDAVAAAVVVVVVTLLLLTVDRTRDDMVDNMINQKNDTIAMKDIRYRSGMILNVMHCTGPHNVKYLINNP